MIASRQCFGNRIRIRRYIFPKEFAEFRLFKDAFQNTPECASLHKSVQVSAYGLAVRHIHKIGNNKNCTVRSRTNAVFGFLSHNRMPYVSSPLSHLLYIIRDKKQLICPLP